MSDELVPIPTTRTLGSTGIEVGSLAYGCWRFAGSTVADATAKIEAAVAAGFTLVDTADIYGYGGPDGFGGAEALLGEVLAASPGLRDRIVLATKGGIRPGMPYDQSASYLREACDASLQRLRTDVIDLYQIHRPDHLASPAEIAHGLDSLVASGKVRAVGVSNFTVAQHRALAAHLDAPLATTQPEWHPLRQEPLTDGTLDLCGEWGMTPLVWSPLAGGRLGGAPEKSDEAAVRVTAVVDRIAAEQGVAPAAVVLAWVAHHPSGAIPIVGSQRVDRIGAAADALRVRLTRTQWYEILVAGRGERMP